MCAAMHVCKTPSECSLHSHDHEHRAAAAAAAAAFAVESAWSLMLKASQPAHYDCPLASCDHIYHSHGIC